MSSRERFDRIAEIFDRACDLPPDRRTVFLREACGDDHDLRAEVESLLDEDADTSGYIALERAGAGVEVLASGLGDDDTRGAARPWPSVLPDRIGPYRVSRMVGQGGMGVVYEATREEPPLRVAIKVIRPGLGEATSKRFLREADILRHLADPGIAAFYESGEADLETSDGSRTRVSFLAMELVEGGTILEHAEREALGRRARIELVIRICDSLDHAHEVGIVHRDLKPANILVARNSDDPPGTARPKILDFGIAHTDRELDIHSVTETRTGMLLGTIAYMSPEQVTGDVSAIDRRTDVYSLGVILFELLTGRLPYDVRGKPVPEAARIISEDDPTKLGSVSMDLRGAIETIVSKMLEKEPHRRYPTTAALAADLRNHLDGRSIQARPPTWRRQVGKLVRRHRALVSGVVGTITALALGLAVTIVIALSEARSRRRAEDNAYRAMIAAATASQRTCDLTSARHYLDATEPERRGWEWYHLAAHLDESLLAIPVEMQRSDPSSVAIDPAGRTLRAVFIDPDGNTQIRAWNLRTGAESGTRIINGPFRSVWLDADGELAYLRDPRYHLLVERVSDGSRVGEYELPPTQKKPSFDLGYRMAAVHTNEGELRVTALRPDSPSRLLASGIEQPRFTLGARGSRCALYDAGVIRLWDLDGDSEILRLDTGGFRARELYIDESSNYLTSVERDGRLRVWSLDPSDSANAPRTLQHGDNVYAVASTPDGERLVTGGDERVLRAWTIRTGRIDITRKGHTNRIRKIAVSRDGGLAASIGDDSTIRVWSIGSDEYRALHFGSNPTSLALDEDGERFFVRVASGHVHAFDVASSRHFATFPSNLDLDRRPGQIAIDGRGRFLAVLETRRSTPRGQLRIFDLTTGEPIAHRTFGSGTRSNACSLALSPDNSTLVCQLPVTGSYVFDTADWTLKTTLPVAQNANAAAVRYHPNGSMLAVSGPASSVLLLDATTFRVLDELTGHTDDIRALAFSPDGRELATSSRDGTVRIWSIGEASARLADVVHASGRTVRTVTYSPDGSRMITGDIDRTIRVWDTASHLEVLTLVDHRDFLESVVMSPDQRVLLSAAGDATVRLWEITSMAERYRARIEYDTIAARMEPWLSELRADHDTTEIANRIRARGDLSLRERGIANQRLLGLARPPLRTALVR